MTHLNDPREAWDNIWEALGDYRENCIPESDPLYDEAWETICESMETIRVEAGLPDPVEEARQARYLLVEYWQEWHTGGGCMALRLDLENGWYLMLTDLDAGLPCKGETNILGLYHDEACCEGVYWLLDWTSEYEVRASIDDTTKQCELLAKHTKVAT